MRAGILGWLLAGCANTVAVRLDELPGELWMPKVEGSRTTSTRGADSTELHCCPELELVGPLGTHVLPPGAGLRLVGDRIEVYLPDATDDALVLTRTLRTAEVEYVRFERLNAGQTIAVVLAGVVLAALLIGSVTLLSSVDDALGHQGAQDP